MEKIKKVLLINPRINVSKGSLRRLPPPLGLLYMAAVLEKESYQVSILDSACEGYDNVVYGQNSELYGLNDSDLGNRIIEERPDFVGVTCSFSKQEEETYAVCKVVKSVLPEIKLAVGGIHPFWFPDKMLKECPEIDFVVRREGEYRLLNLLDAINAGKSFENMDGFACRKNSKIKVNPADEVIQNLDALPYPARHLIDMEKYIEIGLFGNPFPKAERIAQVLTSRGCPYNCDFCATKPYWGRFRSRSADNTISEIIELKNKYDIQEIQFRDDNLTVNRNIALGLFEKMKGLDLVWCSGILIQSIDEIMIKAMAESGCYKLTLSPESGSERVLRDLINKPLKLESVKPVVDLAHKYGISIHSDFIVAYPGETKEEIYRTFEFAKEIGTDSASFFLASPYPGSALYERSKKRGWLIGESYKTDFKNPGIHIPPSDPEYIMPEKELIELIDQKTYEHNEWSKTKNPTGWKEKYSIFLRKHPEEKHKIMGRVV